MAAITSAESSIICDEIFEAIVPCLRRLPESTSFTGVCHPFDSMRATYMLGLSGVMV